MTVNLSVDVRPRHRNRRSYNRLSSVMTPIESSSQWRKILDKAKSAERQMDENVPDMITHRPEVGSVLTLVESSTPRRASSMAVKPAVRKDREKLGDSQRRRRRSDLVSVLTPIENLEQWRSAMAESEAVETLEDGAAMADQAMDLSYKEWLHA